MKLQEGEQILYELQPDSKILGVWFFTKCLGFSLAGVFLIFWAFGFFGGMFCAATKSESSWPISMGGVTAIVAVPFFLIGSMIYCSFLRKTYRYYITNQRCIFHGGILRRVERSIPYHKITDVEASQNIIERIFGISSLKIFTPGTASMPVSPFGGERAEITFVGLKDNESPATTINDMLRK